MAKKEFIIFVAFAALTLASEIEDGEQKKRGAGKTTTLNAIPTGSQKPDYSYNIYQQSTGVQNQPSQSYQAPVSSSFYPSQSPSQYYSSSSTAEAPSSSPQHVQASSQPSQSHFVPINFIPNPGYQTKYQLVPKHNGNVQLAILQPPAVQSTPILQYPHSLFSPNPSHQVSPHSLLGSPAHFGFASGFPQLSLGGPFIGHQPAMVVLPQSHPTLYNNLAYPNPTQSFYNYYPSTSQAKYSYTSGLPSSDYEKVQSAVPQSASKDENDLNVQNSEYLTPPDSNTAYKNPYSRSTYTKI